MQWRELNPQEVPSLHRDKRELLKREEQSQLTFLKLKILTHYKSHRDREKV